MKVYLKDVKELAGGPSMEGKLSSRFKDAAVISAIIKALNPRQKLRGKRKICQWSFAFRFIDSSKRPVALVGGCKQQVKAKKQPAVFIDIQKKEEWGFVIPNGKALRALLKKHLPDAVEI